MTNLNLSGKILQLIVIVTAMTIIIPACGNKETAQSRKNSKQNSGQSENKETMQNSVNKHDPEESGFEHVMVNLPTMQCKICKKNIETAVEKLDGIEEVNVVVKEKTAHINYDKSKTDISKIEAAITSAGYDANDKKADPEAYKELDDCCKLPQDRKEK